MKEVIVHTYLGAKKKGFLVSTFFIKNCIYLFLERGGKREEDMYVREKHRSVGLSLAPTEDPADNPGMCPDWESSRRPFRPQAGAQCTEPQQAGPLCPLHDVVNTAHGENVGRQALEIVGTEFRRFE